MEDTLREQAHKTPPYGTPRYPVIEIEEPEPDVRAGQKRAVCYVCGLSPLLAADTAPNFPPRLCRWCDADLTKMPKLGGG